MIGVYSRRIDYSVAINPASVGSRVPEESADTEAGIGSVVSVGVGNAGTVELLSTTDSIPYESGETVTSTSSVISVGVRD